MAIKETIKHLLESNSFLKEKVLLPIRYKNLAKEYKRLMQLNHLSEESKALWLKRIRIVKDAPENAKIKKVDHAGEIEKGLFVMHNGLKIEPLSYVGPEMLRLMAENKGIHEPQEEYAFQEVLKYIKQNGVMLEVGAYWSFYSMWFAKQVKGARNFMLDNNDGVVRGKENFRLNGLRGTFEIAYVGQGVEIEGVPVITIDEFAAKHKIEFIDLLHADIQGHELSMLQTMPDLIDGMKIGYLFISTHTVELHQQCIDLLKSKGYTIVCEADFEHTFSPDGVLVAKNPNYAGIEKIEISIRTPD